MVQESTAAAAEPTCDFDQITTYKQPSPTPTSLAGHQEERTAFSNTLAPFPLVGSHWERTLPPITRENLSIEDTGLLLELVEDGLLCPFCDQKLQGDEFSPSLKRIWNEDRLSVHTWPSPILWNPNHRDSKSFKVYLNFCEQHRLEEKLLPLARQNGWPTSPNFDEIPTRIQEITPVIRDLIENIRVDPRSIPAPASKFYDAAVQRRTGRVPDLSVLRTRSAG